MNFNATSLVQVLNFLITFWVIKRLFMRPALNVINKAHHHLQNVSDELEHLKEQLNQLAGERDALWHTAQDSFSHEQPAPERTEDFIFHAIVPSLEVIVTTEVQHDEFVREAAQKVVKKVGKTL